MKSLSKLEVAELFGVAQRTVQDWIVKGIPRNGDGTFDAPACVRWYVDKKGASRDLDARLLAAQVAEREAKAESARFRADIERGRLLVAEEVQAGREARIRAVTAGLDAVVVEAEGRYNLATPVEWAAWLGEKFTALRNKFSEAPAEPMPVEEPKEEVEEEEDASHG